MAPLRHTMAISAKSGTAPETRSVEVLAAPSRPAKARNLHVLKRKLVIVRQLLTASDRPQRKDDDVLSTVDQNHLRVAVRVARVINEPRRIPHCRRVNDRVGILAEHVAANPSGLIIPLSLVGQRRSDHFARVFNDHFAGVDVSTAKETSSVDCRWIDPDGLTGEGPQMSESHCHWEVQTCQSPAYTSIHPAV